MYTTCKFCKEGKVYYDPSLTFHEYSLPESFVLEDMDKIVDGIINQYLVYRCDKCGSAEKFTYKEIEELERKRISTLVMNSVARGEIEKAIIRRRPKVLVHCGKCNGLDGRGSCLLETFKNCKLKRLPRL
jgi:DNA-directed RNA polymerase subunit M/transcription elongation factor TFIIS